MQTFGAQFAIFGEYRGLNRCFSPSPSRFSPFPTIKRYRF
uniref:Uncharacterized protein n=1 Tax=uncultured bacterium contig00006 TaxID=1181498 RepID=A0A806KK92_9BACT|nr:hypothetical protein [uncultured bacterium contig00006]